MTQTEFDVWFDENTSDMDCLELVNFLKDIIPSLEKRLDEAEDELYDEENTTE